MGFDYPNNFDTIMKPFAEQTARDNLINENRRPWPASLA
jgi:hypothetical protein